MANRFPLIVDTDDGNKIKELPSGDILNLANSGLTGLSSLSVVGALSGGTLASSGDASVGGNFTVTGTSTFTGSITSGAISSTGSIITTGNISSGTLTVNGETVAAQVQSDWAIANQNDVRFIRNKPDLNNLNINELNDIGDVFVSDALPGEVLTWDGFSWQSEPAAGGIALIDLEVISNPPSGSGSLTYNDATGTFTFTPADLPTTLQELSNDPGVDPDSFYVNVGYLNTNEYLKQSSVLVTAGRISLDKTVDGVITISFDASGLLTAETDTLASVAARGADAETAIVATAFNVSGTSVLTSTLKDVVVDSLDNVGNYTTTNGNITTTNGAITAGGTIQGNTLTATSEGNIPIINGVTRVQNSGGNVLLNGTRIDIDNGLLTLRSSAIGGPASPSIGDIYSDGVTIYFYAQDNGSGSNGWVQMPGQFGTLGLNLPVFDNATPAGAVRGAMIYDENDFKVKVFNGTSWETVGP